MRCRGKSTGSMALCDQARNDARWWSVISRIGSMGAGTRARSQGEPLNLKRVRELDIRYSLSVVRYQIQHQIWFQLCLDRDAVRRLPRDWIALESVRKAVCELAA